MALPVGLVPVLLFVVTVGVSAPVATAAHLVYRSGGPFRPALRAAVVEAGLCYLVGTGVVAVIAESAGLEVAAALLAAGVATLLLLTALPLAIGRRLVSRRGVDAATALRHATAAWPVAMFVAFAVAVAPGGLARGHLLGLDGTPFFATVALLVAVVVLGPGLGGIAVASARAR